MEGKAYVDDPVSYTHLIAKADELAKEIRNSFIPGQFVNPANPQAHIETTGPDVYKRQAVYSYHAYNHYEKDGSMYIHRPDPELSTAENFWRMLRPDMKLSLIHI